MINNNTLIADKQRLLKALEADGIRAAFDHFAIKVPDSEAYLELIEAYGRLLKADLQSGRNIATVVGSLGTFEIMEPKPGEIIAEPFVDHLGFVADDLTQVEEIYPEVVRKVTLGNTAVIFIKKGGEIIQFRTLPLKDFRVQV